MHHHPFWHIERAAGLFLVLGFVANIAGVLMFNIRDGVNGGAPPSHEYYLWERGLLLIIEMLHQTVVLTQTASRDAATSCLYCAE